MKMKMMQRVKRVMDIKKGVIVPLFFCNINIDKFRDCREGSCDINIHPAAYSNLEAKQREMLNYHMKQVVAILRDNIIDVEDLR